MASEDQLQVLLEAGVPNEPIVKTVIDFVKQYLEGPAFNHVMRSCAFSFYIADKQDRLKDVDKEVVALSTLLHDMSWSKDVQFSSENKRFEIDSADAAREFLQREAPDWSTHRVQLVWDAIALHTSNSIALYKEPEVVAASLGISTDFSGPNDALSRSDYNTVVAAFPRQGFADFVKGTLCAFCRSKPQTTYDNFMVHVGKAYVEGYSAEGNTWVPRASLEVLENRLMARSFVERLKKTRLLELE